MSQNRNISMTDIRCGCGAHNSTEELTKSLDMKRAYYCHACDVITVVDNTNGTTFCINPFPGAM